MTSGTGPEVATAVLVAVVAHDLFEYKINQMRDRLSTTFLVVNQTIKGIRKSSIFTIKTDQELRVAFDGRYVALIQPHEIVLTAPPGHDSKIVITDAKAADVVYRRGTMRLLPLRGPLKTIAMHTTGYYGNANFDTGMNKNVSAQDAEVVSKVKGILGIKMSAVNGTRIVPWAGGGQPSRSTCESLPSSLWTTKLDTGTKAISTNRWQGRWCVHTGEGTYGVLRGWQAAAWSPNIGLHLDYVLWK